MPTPREPIEVDYRIRPAKQAERNMIRELVGRLERMRPVTDFRYVGMGSIYFVDFAMIHRNFGIRDMTSIEQRQDILERCRFNKPYDCISILEKSVASALPYLRSASPTVMWLDYTGATDAGRLQEVAVAAADLAPPSLLFVTTDVTVPSEGERLAWFRKHFGNRDASRITAPAVINRKRYPLLMWDYLDAAFRDGVANRPGHAQYEQLLHVRYADGADMLTVGGLIYDDPEALSRCDFGSLPYVKAGREPYHLRVPRLTYRERAALDQLLPDGDLNGAPAGLEMPDVTAYAELYRYAPFFADVNV
jgi:hypothetical protein